MTSLITIKNSFTRRLAPQAIQKDDFFPDVARHQE